MDAVRITNLNYKYPETDAYALRDINLNIAPGEFCSIIGANGAGKTTLCNAIRGFVPHFYHGELTGEVVVNGKNIADHEVGALASDIGYVFQNPFTQMSGVSSTVFDELAYGLGNTGVSPTDIVRRVEEMIIAAGLGELRDRDPLQMSGGQQQRAALASVLVMDQPVLVLDEPTSQLDPQTTDEVFDLIEKSKAKGCTIILVEHKMEQIAQYSDRVVLLDQGRIVLQGTPSEVFADPRCEALGTRLPETLYLRRALENSGLELPDTLLLLDDLLETVANQLSNPRKEVN